MNIHDQFNLNIQSPLSGTPGLPSPVPNSSRIKLSEWVKEEAAI